MYNTIYLGNKVVLDLKEDTVRPETLGKGITAFDADGNLIVGTAVFIGDPVSLYLEITSGIYNFQYGLRWSEFCDLFSTSEENFYIDVDDSGYNVIFYAGFPMEAWDENGMYKGYVRQDDIVQPDWIYYA